MLVFQNNFSYSTLNKLKCNKYFKWDSYPRPLALAAKVFCAKPQGLHGKEQNIT